MNRAGIVFIGELEVLLVRKKSSFMYKLSYNETVLHFASGGRETVVLHFPP